MHEKLKGKKVCVAGMGKSGLSAAMLLVREGAEVLMIDDQPVTPPASLPSQIQFKPGNWSENDLMASDLIVLSPGFPLSKLPLSPLKAAGIPVIGEIELASSLMKTPIIGITGTNGKSTTTSLIGQILQHWGLNVFVGGNLGLPLSEAVGTAWDFAVVELSSFQLETIIHFRPRIAALLNVTPDHLDRYADFTAYQHTKWRIFENQAPEDHAVYNLDDPLTLPPAVNSAQIGFSKNKRPDRGVFLKDGAIQTTVWGGEAENVLKLDTLQTEPMVHIENLLAATAITQLCGCPIEGIAQGLRSFKGLPHRMEFVRMVDGVRYLNDSKGTNTGALMRSLEGLRAPVILIAGGRDKAADFSPLRGLVQSKVKGLILIGEAKEKMAACFSAHPAVETVDHTDGAKAMRKAVQHAEAVAKPGDTVLLSPGCASFDMFENYEARGEQFKHTVSSLK